MPLFTADALILRTYKLAEADRIVVFLTRDRGKKRGVAKGARRLRSRFTGALEPLTHASVAYFEKEQRELVSLNYVDVKRSPLSAETTEALSYVGYFAELIDEWAQDGDPNEKLYRLGASIGEALAKKTPIERLARYFEYWLLRLQGVYPSITVCQRCRADFDDAGALLALKDHVFVCRRCGPEAGTSEVSRAALAFLRAATVSTPERLDTIDLSIEAGRELEAAHSVLLEAHLEKVLKSQKVIRSLRM